MSEKEAHQYEAREKSPAFPLPMSGKVSQQLPGQSPASTGFAAYSQSLPAKSKIILPTAIWIIIVLAGICFLTLLGSLNRTMKTLDTFAELEIENSKLAKDLKEKNEALKAKIEHPSGDHILASSWLRPKFGWPSMGSNSVDDETDKIKEEISSSVQYSNEPSSTKDNKDEIPKELNDAIESLVDEMISDTLPEFKAGQGKSGMKIPIKGRVVISSGFLRPISVSDQSIKVEEHNNRGDTLSPINALFDKLMGVSSEDNDQASVNGKLSDSSEENNQRLSSSSKGDATLIKANTVNINFNEDKDESSADAESNQSNERPSNYNGILTNILGLSSLMQPSIPSPFLMGSSIEPSSHISQSSHPIIRLMVPQQPSESEDSSVLSNFRQRPPVRVLLKIREPDQKSSGQGFESTERPKIPAIASPYEFSSAIDSMIPKEKSNMDAQLDVLSDLLNQALANESVDKTIQDEKKSDNSRFDNGEAPHSSDNSAILIKVTDRPGEQIPESKTNPLDIDPNNPFGKIFKTFFGDAPAHLSVSKRPSLSQGERQADDVEVITTSRPIHKHHNHHSKHHPTKPAIKDEVDIKPSKFGDFIGSENFAPDAKQTSTAGPDRVISSPTVRVDERPMMAEPQTSGDKTGTKVEGK